MYVRTSIAKYIVNTINITEFNYFKHIPDNAGIICGRYESNLPENHRELLDIYEVALSLRSRRTVDKNNKNDYSVGYVNVE